MEIYYEEEKQNQKKSKTPIFIGIFIILLIILTIIVVYAIMYIKTKVLKVKIDNVSQNNFGKLIISTTTNGEEKMYFPIRKVAKYFGYSDYAGDYSTKSEDSTKCYVDNGEEIALFTLNSNVIILARNKFPNEEITIDEKIFEQDGELFITKDGLEKAFNVILNYETTNNTINIYSLNYLVLSYANNYNLSKKEYSIDINDEKAIREGLLIVQENSKYGLLDVRTGKYILETKYDFISYLPYMSQFLVKSNGKYGITDKNGKIKIKVSYDDIEIADSKNKLYIVKESSLYGMVNSDGKIILPSSFQSIGINGNNFEQNRIDNQYILVKELIPVKFNGLWGFYNINGEKVTDFIFTDIGCTISSVTNSYPVVEIPSLNLVVVKVNEKNYNLINRKGVIRINAPLNSVYLKTDAATGKNTYYMTYGGSSEITRDIEEIFASLGVSE